MLYTETAVKDNLRNLNGKRVFVLAEGDRLTASARDWLRSQKVDIVEPQQMQKTEYAALNGAYFKEKPEHMTHLNSQFLVMKNHPRIRFRGKMDCLEAELLLCQNALCGEKAQQVGEILQLARSILRWEVMDEPAQQLLLCGLTAEQLRSHSHFPQKYYDQPHFMPQATDDKIVLLLNRARCAARQAELAAVDAFADENGCCRRTDLLQALNRMSSMLYILMIRQKKESAK